MLTDYFLEHNFDIIALTETWLSDNPDKHKKEIGDITPVGYDFFHIPRNHRTGGGVAILHKDSIKRKECAVFNASTFESLCCDLNVTGTFSPVRLVVIYRAHWKQMEAQGTKGEVPAHSLLTDIIKNSEKTGNKNKSNRIEFQITIIKKQCRFCNY